MTRLGIDLDDNGVTANDANDADDAGANRLQNFPVFIGNATLLGNSIGLTYRVDTAVANATYPLTIEFFVADSNGANPEGRTFLAADQYVGGEAQMNKAIIIPAPAILTNQRLVATATDAAGNSSEFSLPVQIRFAGDPGLGADRHPQRAKKSARVRSTSIQYIAHSTGKWTSASISCIAFGDLDLEVRDQFGNLLATVEHRPTTTTEFRRDHHPGGRRSRSISSA